jgi:hypothetical protein
MPTTDYYDCKVIITLLLDKGYCCSFFGSTYKSKARTHLKEASSLAVGGVCARGGGGGGGGGPASHLRLTQQWRGVLGEEGLQHIRAAPPNKFAFLLALFVHL